MTETTTSQPASLVSWNGDPELKARVCAEMRRHREEDRIVQGIYGDDEDGEWRGCAVGCAVRSAHIVAGLPELSADQLAADYYRFAEMGSIGIPWRLTQAIDDVFEMLSPEDSLNWPVDVLEALPVGIVWGIGSSLSDEFFRRLTQSIPDPSVFGLKRMNEEAARVGSRLITALERCAIDAN